MYSEILIYWVLLAYFSFKLTLIRQCFFLFLLFSCFIFYVFKPNCSIKTFSRVYESSKILLNIYVFNLINFTKLCSLLATFVNTQETFNVVSTLLFGWYDVVTSDNVKSTLKQRCVCQRSNLQRWTTSNQHCLFQRCCYNVRQRRNNAVIFNVEFHNVDQRRNNVVYMTIFKRLKTAKKYFWALKKKITHFSQMWSVEKYENNSMSLLIAK